MNRICSGTKHARGTSRMFSRVGGLFRILLIPAALILAGAAASAASDPEPFRPGERLTFLVTWSAVPVGEGVLEVKPPTTVDGQDARHFTMTVRTNAFADIFYKVRDRMEGFTDMDMTRSLRYRKVSSGSSDRNVVVAFDWETGTARYFNYGEKHASVALLPGSYDPLSVFFAFRFYDLSVGKELTAPLSDGKRSITGRATVLDRETIRVRGSSYDTYLVRVDMGDVDGLYAKRRDAELLVWVTTDHRRLPVRMRSSVIVGQFTVDLVSVSEGY